MATFSTVKGVGPDTEYRKYHLLYDTYRVGGPQQYQTYKKVSWCSVMYKWPPCFYNSHFKLDNFFVGQIYGIQGWKWNLSS